MNNLLIEAQAIRENLKRIQAQVEQLKLEAAQEVDEFNAGYKAFEDGLNPMNAEIEYRNSNITVPSYDMFMVGYAWAKFKAEER